VEFCAGKGSCYIYNSKNLSVGISRGKWCFGLPGIFFYTILGKQFVVLVHNSGGTFWTQFVCLLLQHGGKRGFPWPSDATTRPHTVYENAVRPPGVLGASDARVSGICIYMFVVFPCAPQPPQPVLHAVLPNVPAPQPHQFVAVLPNVPAPQPPQFAAAQVRNMHETQDMYIVSG
jgi:hypothetical protein